MTSDGTSSFDCCGDCLWPTIAGSNKEHAEGTHAAKPYCNDLDNADGTQTSIKSSADNEIKQALLRFRSARRLTWKETRKVSS